METIKELLEKIDVEKTWQEMKKIFFDLPRYTDKKKSEFHNGIIAAINEMRLMDCTSNDNWIVAIIEYYDYDDKNLVSNLATSLYEKSEITDKFHEVVFMDDAEVMATSDDTLKKLVVNKKIIQTWGFEFSDWKEVLGYEVHPGSISKYGLEFCMAYILFEMTYCGFSYDETKNTIDKMSGSSKTCEIDDNNDDFVSYEKSEDSYYYDKSSIWAATYLSWKKEYSVLKEIFDDIKKEGESYVCHN